MRLMHKKVVIFNVQWVNINRLRLLRLRTQQEDSYSYRLVQVVLWDVLIVLLAQNVGGVVKDIIYKMIFVKPLLQEN